MGSGFVDQRRCGCCRSTLRKNRYSKRWLRRRACRPSSSKSWHPRPRPPVVKPEGRGDRFERADLGTRKAAPTAVILRLRIWPPRKKLRSYFASLGWAGDLDRILGGPSGGGARSKWRQRSIVFYRDFSVESPITTGAQHLSAAATRLAFSIVYAITELPDAIWQQFKELLTPTPCGVWPSWSQPGSSRRSSVAPSARHQRTARCVWPV